MSCTDDNCAMQGVGDRLRARARELGWSDAEVARRLGLAQTRYASYVTDRHEPDLATLVRICAVLGVTPQALLGTEPVFGTEVGSLVGQITASALALDPASLAVAVTVVDALLARSAHVAEGANAPTRRNKPGRTGT